MYEISTLKPNKGQTTYTVIWQLLVDPSFPMQNYGRIVRFLKNAFENETRKL